MFSNLSAVRAGLVLNATHGLSAEHPQVVVGQNESAGSSMSEVARAASLTPPLDPSNFDYVYYMENLSAVRQPWSDDPVFVPTAVLYGLAFVFGFLGNLLVALALLVDRRQRAVLARADSGATHSLMTSFLISLAIADVLFLLVCLPYELIVKLQRVWHGGPLLCKLAGYVEMTTAMAAVLNLSAVTIERFRLVTVLIK